MENHEQGKDFCWNELCNFEFAYSIGYLNEEKLILS